MTDIQTFQATQAFEGDVQLQHDVLYASLSRSLKLRGQSSREWYSRGGIGL